MQLLRWCALGLLFALRLPSLVQPAAADQSLYAYIGLRILEGGTPYVDAWDQKPPGIHLLYALLWWLWPDERVVAAADLVAAAAVCALLIALGRRLGSASAGWVAACVFALLGNPSMHRLSGVFVRAQCETFIALAITAALVLLTAPVRRTWHAAAAGVLFGAAVWLKYTAIVFALPLLAALWLVRPAGTRPAAVLRDALVLTAATTMMGVVGLAWIAAKGALVDFWLATYRYNVGYSSEGYESATHFVRYLATMPFRQARRELLWLAGLIGVVFALPVGRLRTGAVLAAAWIAAAVVAIALNGRDLPQYFVQATPALAIGAGLGALAAWRSPHRLVKAAAILVLVAGFWRVGVDRPVYGLRLAGLPGLIENIRFDLAYWSGRIDRRTYLNRFGGDRPQDKYDALAVDDLARQLAATTRPDDRIYVFGFSPGVYVKAQRVSASRFFWNVPVLIEFEAGRPGYGTEGLLADLDATRPVVVALQKGDWSIDSRTQFMAHPGLSAWLERHYRQQDDGPRFEVWRLRGR